MINDGYLTANTFAPFKWSSYDPPTIPQRSARDPPTFVQDDGKLESEKVGSTLLTRRRDGDVRGIEHRTLGSLRVAFYSTLFWGKQYMERRRRYAESEAEKDVKAAFNGLKGCERWGMRDVWSVCLHGRDWGIEGFWDSGIVGLWSVVSCLIARCNATQHSIPGHLNAACPLTPCLWQFAALSSYFLVLRSPFLLSPHTFLTSSG